jgi:ribosomal protein L22
MDVDDLRIVHAVGERSLSLRRCAARHAGGMRSANADMSNVKAGEKPARRKPKVS